MKAKEKKHVRGEALNLTVAALAITLVVLLSVGIHTCLGGESPNQADGMEDTPSLTIQKIRATRVTTGSLALCDKSHPFTESEVEEIEQDCVSLSLFALGGGLVPPLYTLSDPTLRLKPEAAVALSGLATALREAGHEATLLVTQGYLPYDGVGTSPYHSGYDLALSFAVVEEGKRRIIPLSQGEDDPLTRAAALWLVANRARFGFIPAEEGDSLRYVGHPHAAYMEMHKLSLSAYLAHLATYTKTAPLTYVIYGTTYTLYYEKADHGAAVFSLPLAPFSLSGDGKYGFVVCYLAEGGGG